MYLLLRYFKDEISGKEKEAINCILLNASNPIINKIIIFSDMVQNRSLNHSKILILNKDYNFYNIAKFCTQSFFNDICIISSPFCVYDESLSYLKRFNFRNTYICLSSSTNRILNENSEDVIIFKGDANIKEGNSYREVINGVSKNPCIDIRVECKYPNIVTNSSNNPTLVNDNIFDNLIGNPEIDRAIRENKIRSNENKKSEDITDISVFEGRRLSKVPTNKEKQMLFNELSRRHPANVIINNKINSGKINKLDIVIVSVNYNDYLLVSLNNNRKYIDKITVVTSSEDFMCQKICEMYKVKCVITDIMYEGGAKFNKGKAINEGIKSIENPDWILLMDSDIVIPEELIKVINGTKLDINYLYGTSRIMCEGYERYKDYRNGNVSLYDLGKTENSAGYGFFQLFNIKSPNIDRMNPFPTVSDDASWSDLIFRDKFTKRGKIEYPVIHLGESYINWFGRTTSKFIDDQTINELLGCDPKIDFGDQVRFAGHRSGWEFAISCLEDLTLYGGVKFDGFIEDKFSWKYDYITGEDGVQPLEKTGILPYQDKWVGFIHNPHNMPEWFDYNNSPQEILKRRIFKESLKNCAGLWALSEYQATWLRENFKVPVSVVYHPTDTDVPQFDYNKFIDNKDKKIYQIGWWLRRVNSIYLLPIKDTYRKIRLDPKTDGYKIQNIYDREKSFYNLTFINEYYNNTYLVNHLSNEDYDNAYIENITFVHLYDASANNAVIEAIARATPLLINPLPAVVEYLGEDYPFYFNTLEEAASKAMDMELILKTNNYLKNSPMREKITGDYFYNSIKNSEVYKSL